MKRYLLASLLVLLILSVSAWTQTRIQWEYKVEYNANEKKLNQLASQGWELVAVSPDAETKNLTGFYFKRAQ